MESLNIKLENFTVPSTSTNHPRRKVLLCTIEQVAFRSHNSSGFSGVPGLHYPRQCHLSGICCHIFTLPNRLRCRWFVNNLARRDSNATFHPFLGANVAAAYNIAATFCSPSTNPNKEKTILLASHGLAYDGRNRSGELNFVDFGCLVPAISKGYSIFFYDRLGTGLSSKVSGYEGSDIK
ncbi:hypothetical protein BDZ45DRAFT_736695 [Acephala macrosclerotiorum]|nr:hypothetical protein BDZ45DRAFT_736695 [Acephala macrosclerotiorum]